MRAELHFHTNISDGILKPQEAVEIAVQSNLLQTLAITDHESIRGAEIAQNYAAKKGYKLEIVVGAELTTRDGHLLGLFLTDDIPTGKGLEWTIEQIHKQGGLAIIAHPMYALTRSVGKPKLVSIIENDCGVHIDGFEVLNTGLINLRLSDSNKRAAEFYQNNINQLGAPIGSSDGHYFAIGRGITQYSGNLYEAICCGETTPLQTSVSERIQVYDVAVQLKGSMVLEPLRRARRYFERVKKGEELSQLKEVTALLKRYE